MWPSYYIQCENTATVERPNLDMAKPGQDKCQAKRTTYKGQTYTEQNLDRPNLDRTKSGQSQTCTAKTQTRQILGTQNNLDRPKLYRKNLKKVNKIYMVSNLIKIGENRKKCGILSKFWTFPNFFIKIDSHLKIDQSQQCLIEKRIKLYRYLIYFVFLSLKYIY